MQRRIWAIADTHLSFANPKPMDIFGSRWFDHANRIKVQCKKIVSDDDLLLIPGDISWAMRRKDAEVDLEFLLSLPGIKVLCKGNHDYWWNSDKRLSCPGLNDTPYSLPDRKFGVAGTRGWTATTAEMTLDERTTNNTIITRELKRLSRRLDAIADCAIKYVMVHYPPLDEFYEIIASHGVAAILYGHLHLRETEEPVFDRWHGIPSFCVAADRIHFTPKLVQTLSA